MTSALAVNFKSSFAEWRNAFRARHDRQICSRCYLDNLNLIIRDGFTSLAENIFMQRDCLAHICPRFVAALALADAAGKARYLCYHIAIFSGI